MRARCALPCSRSRIGCSVAWRLLLRSPAAVARCQQRHHAGRTAAPLRGEYAPQALTRLGPSRHVPGTTGVFCTATIKKFTPLEIAPAWLHSGHPVTAVGSVSSSPLSGASRGLQGSSEAEQSPASSHAPPGPRTGTASGAAAAAPAVCAPPFVCNLIRAPRHSISLRRFLALRAQFSDKRGAFLHVATERGWYLLLPAALVPVADEDGLRAWLSRHHHRYLTRPSRPADEAGSVESAAPSAQLLRHRRAGELDALQRQWVDLTKPGEAPLLPELSPEGMNPNSLDAAQRRRGTADAEEDEEDDEGDDEEDDEEMREEQEEREYTDDALQTAQPCHPSARLPAAPATLTRPPLAIPEEHLFEINDGIYWPLPPPDDLTSPTYWSGHRARMRLYDSTSGAVAGIDALATTARGENSSLEDQAARLADAIRGRRLSPPPESAFDDGEESADDAQSRAAAVPTEQEALAQSTALVHALTRKANVALDVDDATGLLTLHPLVNLHPGDELLLHYGREWWAERLLSPLTLAAATESELRGVRWIEKLFAEPTDVSQPFPWLAPYLKQRGRPPTRTGGHRRRRASGGRDPAAAAAKAGADGRHAQSSESHSAAKDRSSMTVTCRGVDATPATESLTATEASSDEPAGKAARLHTARPRRRSLVLCNVSARREATDAEVLMFAVRLSCVSRAFLELLLIGRRLDDSTTTTVDAFFSPRHARATRTGSRQGGGSGADAEIPLRRLRRVLLYALRGYPPGEAPVLGRSSRKEAQPAPAGHEERRHAKADGGPSDSSSDSEDEPVFKI